MCMIESDFYLINFILKVDNFENYLYSKYLITHNGIYAFKYFPLKNEGMEYTYKINDRFFIKTSYL